MRYEGLFSGIRLGKEIVFNMGFVFLSIMFSFVLMVTGGMLQNSSLAAVGFVLCMGAMLYAPVMRFVRRIRNRK